MPLFWETLGEVAIIAVPTCIFAVKYLLKKEANIFFDKRLEQYKAELKLFAKQAEFDFSRKEVAFNVFFNKKHDCYFQFYDLVSKANGAVRSLVGFRKDTPINMMRTPDIEITLKNQGFSDALVSDYMERIEKNGLNSVSEDLRKLMRSAELHTAERVCWEAKNHLIVSRLYFDNSLFKTCIDLCNQLLFLQSDYEIGFQVLGGSNPDNQKEYIANIDRMTEEVIAFMQNELSVGYFQTATSGSALENGILEK